MTHGGSFTTIDPVGSIGTYHSCVNDKGSVTGRYVDANNVSHGFEMAPDGTFTTFDPKGSTFTYSLDNNDKNEVTGYYADSGGVYHGYVYKP
jgi:hypothetical protein